MEGTHNEATDRTALRHRFAVVVLGVALGAVGPGCGDDTAGTCPDELSVCQEAGGDVCTDTAYDPDHCGTCGNACDTPPQALAACVAGQCLVAACEDNYGDCNNDIETDGCETDLLTSMEHCGGCGTGCFATEMCQDGQCVEDPNQATRIYLQITGMDTNSCAAVEHAAVTGGEIGGLAVGTDGQERYFYYSGLLSGGRFNLDDPGNNPTAVPTRYSIFSDLATGKVYAFTVAGSPAAPECDETIDGFIELDPGDLSTVGNMVALSSPITWTCDNDNGGVFSGRGQVLLHDMTGTTHTVSLPDGTVTDSGTQVQLDNARSCVGWAISGIAESFDGDTYAVYRSTNPQAIVRHSVMTGSVETILDLSAINVRNLCSISADLAGNQWVWHYQGSGDLDQIVGGFQIAGTCPATFEYPTK